MAKKKSKDQDVMDKIREENHLEAPSEAMMPFWKYGRMRDPASPLDVIIDLPNFGIVDEDRDYNDED